MNPLVESFFDPASFTFSHIVYDVPGGTAAIIDPVLDYDAAAARTSTHSADRLLEFVAQQRLHVAWILETHAHADHLTAAHYLRERTGAKIGIGRGITAVQAHFKPVFGLQQSFPADGSQFDHLFDDGETFSIGQLLARVLATPGHTSDSLTYVVGDSAFIGDTLFAPETGTARTDFPGGDAHTLYHSIQRILNLPEGTRLFLCHDYPPADREARAETTIVAQSATNIHVGGGKEEGEFVSLRTARDATLAAPKLILPALQVNIRAGALPVADDNGTQYLRLPVNVLGTGQ